MIGLIKKLLYSLLGKSLYLRLISWSFLKFYWTGILSLFSKFQVHYLVRKLIKPGDRIIDIGANLGYYTGIFAALTGKEGLVWAIEPVKLYRNILARNTRKYTNVQLIPFALGSEEEDIMMAIPSEKKYRHGLTRVIDKNEKIPERDTYQVKMKTPETLFNNIDGLDYIKCDIEGYEGKVIPGFTGLIEQYNPVIQIELDKNNFDSINSLLSGLGYKAFHVNKRKLELLAKGLSYSGDLFYIHIDQVDNYKSLLNISD